MGVRVFVGVKVGVWVKVLVGVGVKVLVAHCWVMARLLLVTAQAPELTTLAEST